MDAPQFLAALHELFDVNAGSIHKETVLQDIAGWSSMTFIGLIAMLDEDFGGPATGRSMPTAISA